MQHEVRQTWFFNQTPQEVWEYLTKPELIEQWLAKTDFQPLPGHQFQFNDKSGKVISCQVLEVKPFTQLSYAWRHVSAKDSTPFDSTVLWRLVPKSNGTELQLVHNGFIAQEDYVAHNNGWNNCLNRMQELSKPTSHAHANA